MESIFQKKGLSPIRIGFDISQTAENKAGCGFVADQLIRALARLDHENEYLLYHNFYDYKSPNTEPHTSIEQANFKALNVDQPMSPSDEVYGNVDIIHSNNYRYPARVSAKKVVVLHDVVFMDVPEYTTEANRLICFQGTLDSMLFADRIIATSQYTKDRLLHFFPATDPDRVRVCYWGNRTALVDMEDCVDLIESLGLEQENYYLSVGTIEPRKNYRTLVDAYVAYRSSVTQGERKKLCIAGGYGWKEEDFIKYIHELGLQDDICVTGYVSDITLANLYRHCYAFVYTTWYEGFGLPVLEAMNFKRPVICSNVTSLPEVTGGAGVLISPDDVQGFSRAMLLLQQDPSLWEKQSIVSYKRSQYFSWDKTAETVLGIYREIM